MKTYEIITIVVILVAGLTVIYRLLPFRSVSKSKPFLSIMPKYRTEVETNLSSSELELKLAQYGFKKSKVGSGIDYYDRGTLLGDFSAKLLKVKLGVSNPVNRKTTITLEAAWIVAFDTGDFWSFINELKTKLQNA